MIASDRQKAPHPSSKEFSLFTAQAGKEECGEENLRSVIPYAISNRTVAPITDYSRLKYLSIDKRGDGIWAKIPFAGSKLLKKIPPAQGGKLAGQRRETFNF
jgi:hypothetical protein